MEFSTPKNTNFSSTILQSLMYGLIRVPPLIPAFMMALFINPIPPSQGTKPEQNLQWWVQRQCSTWPKQGRAGDVPFTVRSYEHLNSWVIWLFVQQFVWVNIKEKLWNLHYWPYVRESTGDWWIPTQRASNVESISMKWCCHATGT